MLEPMIRFLGAVGALLLLVTGPASATLIIDGDSRYVQVSGPDRKSHPEIGGAFDESLWLAWQDTLAAHYLIGGYMGASYYVEEGWVGDQPTYDYYSGISFLEVSFHVDESTPFRLSGEVADEYAELTVELTGGGLDFSYLWYEGDLSSSTSFDLDGTLEPGNSYLLRVLLSSTNYANGDLTFGLEAVPEPGTALLCGLGLGLLGVRASRRRVVR